MGKRGRNQEFWNTTKMNDRTFIQYYNRLMELSISMFEWKNLPDTVDPRFLELALFTDGHAVFFRDDVIGYLSLRCALSGPFNVYRIPVNRRVISESGYTASLNDTNSIIIWNNFIHSNAMLDVEMFAIRLYDIDRSIDVNARAQKTPVLIQCDETERLSLENVYKSFDGNAPVIFGTKGLSKDAISCIQTGAPYVADKLYQLKTQIWNEALTYLGINNINITKKERLITDEVTRNQGGTIASRYSRLESRRQACEQINRMFGTDIWCDYREDFQVHDFELNETTEGGDDNE